MESTDSAMPFPRLRIESWAFLHCSEPILDLAILRVSQASFRISVQLQVMLKLDDNRRMR